MALMAPGGAARARALRSRRRVRTCGCVRWGRLDWREPLRERTPVEVDLMTRSMFGIASPATVHAQYRVGPVRAVTGFFLILGGELALLGASSVATYAALAVGAAAAIVWLLVVLFNRPRWAVPPGVRSTVGIVEYKRREPPREPEFRDPLAVPPPLEKLHDPGS